MSDDTTSRIAFPTPSWRVCSAVFALLGIYIALGLTASTRKSQTGDEGVHLAGGYSYWAFNDYRVQPENGNWPQRWCAIPVYLGGYQFPPTDGTPWGRLEQWTLGDQFFYELGNNADGMLLRGRAMTAIFGVALGLLIFSWSRRLFGDAGGLVSLALFAFSPAMLTHGFLITSDMACALFFTASIGALWRLLHRLSPMTIFAAWFSLSGLFLSKFSAPLIVPIGLLLFVVRLLNGRPTTLQLQGDSPIQLGRLGQFATLTALIPVLALGVAGSIWASYGFRYAMLNPAVTTAGESVPWGNVGNASWVVDRAIREAREYRLLPEGYLFGFSHVMHFAEARNAFFNGEMRRYGWLSFFPFCMATKTPIEFFLMLLLAAGAIVKFCPRARDQGATTVDGPTVASFPRLRDLCYELSPLAIFWAVYWAVALNSHLNIGHRHLLPTYPPLLIFAGAAGWWISTNARHLRAIGYAVLALVAVSAGEVIWIWPNYLAYFNLFIGGPSQGYKHLGDSSLDWSQDLKEVRRWLDAHPDDDQDPSRLYFSFYGSPPPAYYGIKATTLPGFPFIRPPHDPAALTGGTYLVSATMLQALMLLDAGRWNRDYEARYQNLRSNVASYLNLSGTPEGRQRLAAVASADDWQAMFKTYEEMRFSRLTSYLRTRTPDDEIGYSILVYRLTDDEVAQAVTGDPVELLDMPEWLLEDVRLGRAVRQE